MTADRVPRRTAGLAGLLRERRLAAGLTQADLAARAGLAVRTVRELEQGRTVRPRRATALLIARTLRLTGQELAEFLAAARGDVESADPVVERAQPLVRLVGRDQELARLVDTLTDPDAGLVTLVGLAGVGKSALAAAVRQQVVGCFSGGVKSITVDPADPADALLARVSARFGATTPTQLAASLAGERALLVLDGAQAAPDQVRQAVAQLPSEVTVLVAARAPVGVPCEIVWPVPPLALPPASAACAPSDVRRYPAVAYFLERLTEVRREPPDGDEMAATVALVRRLDGIPSALEWAASHGRLLPVTEILRRYVDGTLDATPVQASVAASYRLFTPPQRRGLRRLAAFRDRWSLELAEQVLGGEVDPMSFLDRLASLGLVEVGGAMSGIRLWEVVRRFAVAHAQQRGEWAEARRIHASVIARAADHRAPRLPAPGTRAALTQLDRFRSDIWAALNYAANHEPSSPCASPRRCRCGGGGGARRRWATGGCAGCWPTGVRPTPIPRCGRGQRSPRLTSAVIRERQRR